MNQIDHTLSDSGDNSIESNGLQPLQSLSTTSSPTKLLPNNKTLRRKRSSANAALTSRPSLLNLRDGRIPISKAQMSPTFSNGKIYHSNMLGLTPSSPFTLNPNSNFEEGMDLQQSMTTLSLDHNNSQGINAFPGPESVFSSSATESETGATFSDISMSRRTSWDVVEDEQIERNRLILVHVITTFDQNNNVQSQTLGHALITPNILITNDAQITPIQDINKWTKLRATVEQSRIVAMCTDETKRTFEISSGEQTSKQISTFYLQSDMSVSDGEQGEMLKIIIRGLDGEQIDKAKLELLPEQVRALIRQSTETVDYSNQANTTMNRESQSITSDSEICCKILRLVVVNDV